MNEQGKNWDGGGPEARPPLLDRRLTPAAIQILFRGVSRQFRDVWTMEHPLEEIIELLVKKAVVFGVPTIKVDLEENDGVVSVAMHAGKFLSQTDVSELISHFSPSVRHPKPFYLPGVVLIFTENGVTSTEQPNQLSLRFQAFGSLLDMEGPLQLFLADMRIMWANRFILSVNGCVSDFGKMPREQGFRAGAAEYLPQECSAFSRFGEVEIFVAVSEDFSGILFKPFLGGFPLKQGNVLDSLMNTIAFKIPWHEFGVIPNCSKGEKVPQGIYFSIYGEIGITICTHILSWELGRIIEFEQSLVATLRKILTTTESLSKKLRQLHKMRAQTEVISKSLSNILRRKPSPKWLAKIGFSAPLENFAAHIQDTMMDAVMGKCESISCV